MASFSFSQSSVPLSASAFSPEPTQEPDISLVDSEKQSYSQTQSSSKKEIYTSGTFFSAI